MHFVLTTNKYFKCIRPRFLFSVFFCFRFEIFKKTLFNRLLSTLQCYAPKVYIDTRTSSYREIKIQNELRTTRIGLTRVSSHGSHHPVEIYFLYPQTGNSVDFIYRPYQINRPIKILNLVLYFPHYKHHDENKLLTTKCLQRKNNIHWNTSVDYLWDKKLEMKWKSIALFLERKRNYADRNLAG